MATAVACIECNHENKIFDKRCEECNKPLPYNEDQNVRYVSDPDSRELSSNFGFAVQFECLNCGCEWEHKFKKGDRVLDKSGRYSEVQASIDQSAEYPENAPSKYRTRIIICKGCGSELDVSIVDRIPAKEYEESE